MAIKKIKSLTIRTDEENLNLFSTIFDKLKDNNVLINNSKNEFFESILIYTLYDENAKFLNYRGKKISLLDIDEIKPLILASIRKYVDLLKECFISENHLDSNGDQIYMAGYSIYFDYNAEDGIILEGNDTTNTHGFFVSYPILKMILNTYILMKDGIDIPIYLNALVLDILSEEMSQYYLENNVFKKISENNKNTILNKFKYYRFEKYSGPNK